MADVRIQDLTESSDAANDETLIEISQGGNSRKMAFGVIFGRVSSMISAAISALGLGALAYKATVTPADFSGTLPINKGGTGGTTALAARNNMGLHAVAASGSYNDLNNRPTLFSGNYADLNNKPAIPTQPADIGAVSVTDANAALATKADATLGNVTQADARAKVGAGTMAYRNVTISSANPSGGVYGDVWLKV